MYRCQICNALVGPGVRQNRVIAKKREKEYHHENDKVTQGWEIIEELAVCLDCMGK